MNEYNKNQIDIELNQSIHKWYSEVFKEDDLKNDIDKKITFKDLFDKLNNNEEIYSYVAHDSVVRQRVFDELSYITKTSFAIIHDKWAFKEDYPAIEYGQKYDRDYLRNLFKTIPEAMRFSNPKEKSDKELVLIACAYDGNNLKYVSKELQNDKDIVITAVRQNGEALQYADKLRDDKRFVLKAVKANPDAYFYVSDRLLMDNDIVYLAKFNKDEKAFSGDIKDCFEFNGKHFFPVGFSQSNGFYEISNHLGKSLMNRYGEDKTYSYNDFYKASGNSKADIFVCYEDNKFYIPGTNELFQYTGKIIGNYELLETTSNSIRGNKELMLTAIKQNKDAFNLISNKLKTDKDILKLVKTPKSIDERLKEAKTIRESCAKEKTLKEKTEPER